MTVELTRRRSRWIRAGQAVLVLTLFLWVFYQFWQGSTTLLNESLQLRWALLVGSLGLLWLSSLLTPLAWVYGVRGMGGVTTYRDALIIVGYSQLGRYLPGQIWSAAWMVAEGKKRTQLGVSENIVVTVIFQLGSVLAGTLCLASGIPFWAELPSSVRFGLPIGLVFLVAVTLNTTLVLRILAPLCRRFFKIELGFDTALRGLRRATLLIFIAWLGTAIAYAVFLNGITPVPFIVAGIMTSLLAGSTVIGLLVLIVPSGLGVTEGIMTLFSAKLLDEVALAALIALSTRMWWIAKDLLSMIVALVLDRAWLRKKF